MRPNHRWSTVAAGLWVLVLVGATAGYALGRAVFDRGVVYGASFPVMQDLDVPRRAINTQLEVEPDVESIRRALRMIRAAGFGIIRQQFAWAAVEGGGKGVYYDTQQNRSTWERFDQIIALAREEGIDVLARLDLPPEWARPPDSHKSHPPVDSRDYGDFVATFVDRYRDQVKYIQLWNEPNLNAEWGLRQVDPAGYVELLRAGYEAAKRASPRVRVLSAELAQTLEPDDPSASGLDDLVYLDRMYLHGARPYFDVLAANAYGLKSGPERRQVGPRHTNYPRLLLTREVMLRHGDGGKAVWVTEFGWNALPPNWTGEPSPWGQVSPQQQARNIVGAYERARVEWPWLGPLALWLFRKPDADRRDPTPFFALVDEAWRPRPAYDRLAETASIQPAGVGIHQDTSSALAFSGTWQWTPDARASLGEMHETPVSGAALRVHFRGTDLSLLAPVGPTRGIAYVKVNGAYTLANRLPLNQNGQAIVDFYAPEEAPQRRIAIAAGLPDRVHELELTVSGEHSPLSGGAGVGIDAVIVSRARTPWPAVALAAVWVAGCGWMAWPLRARLSLPLSLRAAIARTRRLTVFATIAVLPLAPLGLRTPAGTYSPLELAALLAIGAWLLGAVLDRGRRQAGGAFAGPFALLLVAGLLSTTFADYPRLALRELRTLVLEPALFYFAARGALRGRSDAFRVAGVLAAGAAAAAVLALVQLVAGEGRVAAEGVVRTAGLYRSPNHLALVLDRLTPFAVAGALFVTSRRRALFRLAAALCLLALFLTFSRGAWIATAAALAVLAWPALRPGPLRRPAFQPKTLAAAGAVAGILLVAAATLALRFERFRSMFGASGTGFLRLHLWESALRMALDHPIFGVGLDQFLYHYAAYMHPDAWREPNLSHPHQVVLDFWLRLGLPGVVVLVWAAVVLVRCLRRIPRYLPAARVAGRGATGAAVAFLVHGLVDNSFFLIDLAYATVAMLLAAELASEESP